MTRFQPPEGFTPDSLFDSGAPLRPRRRRRRYAPPPPFESLPRARRRDLAASLSWRIQSDPNGQGVFTSHDILPGSREWPASPGQAYPVQWADALFLSRAPLRQGRFFNATIETLALLASRQVVDKATQAIQERMSPADRRRRGGVYSRPLPQGGCEMWFAPDPGLDSLGGLTAPGARAAWLREHWEDWPAMIEVSRAATFLPGYAHGQGLRLAIDAPGLTTHEVARAIERFRDGGEREFQSAPVDLDHRRERIEALLGVHLWRWEAQQAKSEGRPEPDAPPPGVMEVFDHESNAVRIPGGGAP